MRSTATRTDGPAGACAAKEQTDRAATKKEVRVRCNRGLPLEEDRRESNGEQSLLARRSGGGLRVQFTAVAEERSCEPGGEQDNRARFRHLPDGIITVGALSLLAARASS